MPPLHPVELVYLEQFGIAWTVPPFFPCLSQRNDRGINESLEIYRLIYGNCDGNYYDVDGDYGYHQFNSSVLAEDGNWIEANIRMSVRNFLKSELKSLLDLLIQKHSGLEFVNEIVIEFSIEQSICACRDNSEHNRGLVFAPTILNTSLKQRYYDEAT